MRVLMGLAGIGLLIPIHSHFFTVTLLINISGGCLALVLLMLEWRLRPPKVTSNDHRQDRK
jgi:hypothetical protein